MKALVLLLLALPLFAAPERIVVVRDYNTDLPLVQNMLKEGWTVKHQSARGVSLNSLIIVFTLIPPEALLTERAYLEKARADEEQRLAEVRASYARKRAEWLAKQPKVEKP
jgi:hypothetical protein